MDISYIEVGLLILIPTVLLKQYIDQQIKLLESKTATFLQRLIGHDT